ncbi:gp471 [Bacillus phage G]|uniref:Gp471 n=1 Tax=Bacillus phage G TaxID=2884420 RepID=G3MAL2_9CAUD|nr:gp471 [Bacillus phage G]AEO93729.1 gp471 [Bacillus phage G]
MLTTRIKQFEFNTTPTEDMKLFDILSISDNVSITKDGLVYHVTSQKDDTTVEFSIVTNTKNYIINIIYDKQKPLFLSNQILVPLINIAEDYALDTNKELQEKLTTILCKDNFCPICNSQLIEGKRHELKCNNNCYSISYSNYTRTIDLEATIFNEEFQAYGDQSIKDKIEAINLIYEQISHWKENDKYLTKILKGEN